MEKLYALIILGTKSVNLNREENKLLHAKTIC